MTEVARLSVVVNANVAAAASKLKAVDSQFNRVTGSATAMDRQVRMSAAKTNAAMASTGRSAKSSAATTAAAAGGLAAANKGVAASAARVGAASQATRGALMGMGMGMSATQGTVLALAYGLGKSVQVAAKFDGAMRNVNSIAGLSETKFQELSSSVQALSGPTAQSPQKLAEGMYQLVSSGFNASESLKIMKSSAIAASAGLTTAETATTAVAGVLNAYHLSASKAAQVSDDLFQTVNLGVLSFEDLAQGIGPVLPFAERLGVNLKQVGAMTATLTKAGVPAAESFTYMKGAMAQLVKPTTDMKRQFKELGVTSGRELVSKTGSLQSALESLFQSVGSNDKKFAKLFPDIRGLSAAFTATGSGAKGAAADLADFNNTAGATSKVFAEQKKSTQFKFKQLSVDVQNAATSMGKLLKPAADGSMSVLGQVAKATGNAAEGWLDLAAGIKAASDALKDAGGARVSQLDNFKPPPPRPRVRPGNMADVKKIIANNPFKAPAPVNVKMGVDLTGIKTGKSKAQQFLGNLRNSNPKIKIDADASGVKTAADKSNALIAGLRNGNPKLDVSSNAATVTTTTQTAINAVSGKKVFIDVVTRKSGGNADTVVNGGRLPGQAMGGTGSGLMRVGEQGPEVVSLPEGSRVWSAGATRRMDNGMDLPGYAKGGWARPKRPEKHKGESKKSWRKRLDAYQKRLQKWENKIERRNSGIDRMSGIGDSNSDKAIAEYGLVKDKDGNTVEDTAKIDAKNVSRAKRHLDEAYKKKGKDRAPAIAAANAELAQAKKTQALNAAQLQDNTDAITAQTEATKAHTDAITSLGKSIDEWNRIAWTTHTVSDVEVKNAIKGIANRELGGDLGANRRTLGPVSGASY